MTTSLRSRIAAAKSLKEIQSLLAEGDKYAIASSGTRNSWRKAANQRGAELGKQDMTAYTEEAAPVVKPKKAASKKKLVTA